MSLGAPQQQRPQQQEEGGCYIFRSTHDIHDNHNFRDFAILL